jgi:ATP-binding cassette subfamily G (WHITE) protein 2 (PDR)
MNHRNFGIIIAFTLFFMFTYLYSTEKIAAKKSKGEVLLFRRGHLSESKHDDIESSSLSKLSRPVEEISVELPPKVSRAIQRQTAVFQWKNICFDIKMKKETRRILDHVDGWVKPGTLTALMVCHPMMSNGTTNLIYTGAIWSRKNNLT